MEIFLGYNNNGDSYESASSPSLLSADLWYHVGITYNDADKSYRIRIRQDGQAANDYTGNFTNNISVEDASLRLAAAATAQAFSPGCSTRWSFSMTSSRPRKSTTSASTFMEPPGQTTS